MNVVIQDIREEPDINNLIIMYHNCIELKLENELKSIIIFEIYNRVFRLNINQLEFLKNFMFQRDYNVFDLIPINEKSILYYYINTVLHFRKNTPTLIELINFNDIIINVNIPEIIHHCFLLIDETMLKLMNTDDLVKTVDLYYCVDLNTITGIYYYHEISSFIVYNLAKSTLDNLEYMFRIISNRCIEYDVVYWCCITLYQIRLTKSLKKMCSVYKCISSLSVGKSLKQFLRINAFEYFCKLCIENDQLEYLDPVDLSKFANNEQRVSYIYNCLNYLKSDNCLYMKKQFIKFYPHEKKILNDDYYIVKYYLDYITYSEHVNGINDDYIFFDY